MVQVEAAPNPLMQSITSGFLQQIDNAEKKRDFIEYIWRDLPGTLGTQNQDLTDLHFLSYLAEKGNFDAILEVGRGGGTCTCVIIEYKPDHTQFISVCPNKGFFDDTLPELKQRSAKARSLTNCDIIIDELQNQPIAQRLADCKRLLLLFDGDHSAPFANYYVDNVVRPLIGKEIVVGVHDIFKPSIQKHARPNQWDDPKGPFVTSRDIACRWDEVITVDEFLAESQANWIQTGSFYQASPEAEKSPYFKSIMNVTLPPYPQLWPFDGAAGTWLFFTPVAGYRALPQAASTAASNGNGNGNGHSSSGGFLSKLMGKFRK